MASLVTTRLVTKASGKGTTAASDESATDRRQDVYYSEPSCVRAVRFTGHRK